MAKLSTLTASLLAAIVTAPVCAQPPDEVEYRGGRLNGMQNVPPSMTVDKGSVIIKTKKSQRRVEVLVQLEDMPAASVALHRGPRGMMGPQLLVLDQRVTNTWTGTTVLNQSEFDDVLAGNTYVQTTSMNPFNAIRAQAIAPPDRVLKGQAVGSGAGTGTVKLSYSVMIGTLNADVNLSGVPGRVTSVSLRTGSTTASTQLESFDPGVGNENWQLDADNWDDDLAPKVAQLLNCELFVVVATDAAPTGALAFKVVECDPPFDTMTSSPDNSQVVPPATNPSAGHLTLTMQSDGSVDYELTTDTPATTAEVRKGQPGSNGPVVFSLSGGPVNWAGQTAPLTQQQKDDLVAGQYYVETSDGTAASAKVRGQIETVEGTTSFGFGCSATGMPPALYSYDPAIVGQAFRLQFHDTEPGSLTALFIGVDINVAATKVPIEGVGDDCNLLVLPAAMATTVAGPDGSGDFTLAIPLDPSLFDGELFFQEVAASLAGFELSNAAAKKIK